MSVSDESIQRIQKFIQSRQAAESEALAEPLGATALHAYARRLDGTLQQLQQQIQRQEEELNKVRPHVEGVEENRLLMLTFPTSFEKVVVPSACQARSTILGHASLRLDAPRRHMILLFSAKMIYQNPILSCQP